MERIGTTIDGDFIITMTQEEFEAMPPPTLPDGIVLPYPHVSQAGAGYPDLTVDEVSARYQRPDQPMHIHEVRSALGGYGMANRHQRPITAVEIAAYLVDEMMPVIALVSYHALPYHAPGYEDYRYAHYILVYGMRGNLLLYHDPLADGRELAITAEQMNIALQSEGNLPNQAILLI